MTQGKKVKGRQFTAEVILWAVRWYLMFPISYRDLELMLQDRGVEVDHFFLYRKRWFLIHRWQFYSGQCTDCGQKQDPGGWIGSRGIDTTRPVTEERFPFRLHRILPRRSSWCTRWA